MKKLVNFQSQNLILISHIHSRDYFPDYGEAKRKGYDFNNLYLYLRMFISSAENIHPILTSLIFGMLYPTCGFEIFVKTWKYYLCTSLVLYIKFGVSIFISFGDTKH